MSEKAKKFKARRHPIEGPTDVSMILVDLSGFTQVLYQASRDPELTKKILRGVQQLFSRTTLARDELEDFSVVNTTGDGFLALATGKTPTRTALEASKIIGDQFDQRFKSILGMFPFRARVDLRMGLHHGTVFSYSMPSVLGDLKLYNGDDINLLARVVSSTTARRYGTACTRRFAERLMLGKAGEPDEVILDKSVYPEPIEIYRVPERVPDYAGKSDSGE